MELLKLTIFLLFIHLSLTSETSSKGERKSRRKGGKRREKSEKPSKAERRLKKVINSQKKDMESLQDRLDAMETDNVSLRTELSNDIDSVRREKTNVDNQLELLKGERGLVASRLKSMESHIADMSNSLNRQHRRIDQLETDNKRLANHNESLLSQLVKQGKNGVRTDGHRGPVGRRKLPVIQNISIGSIQIAEPDTVIISGGIRNGETVNTVTAIRQDFSSVALEELPVPLKYHCSTVYAGQVFVIGGMTDGGFPRNNVYMLMTGRSWRVAASMIYPRAQFGCTMFEEFLWVAGGADRDVLKSTEKFGVFSEVWESGPQLIIARQEAPVVRTSSGLWIIGGKNSENEVLTSVEFLSSKSAAKDSIKLRNRNESKSQNFQEATPLPLAMEGLSATVINNIVYLSGTSVKTQLSTILQFDGKSWNPAGKLLNPRYSAKAIGIRNSIWVLGGCCAKMSGLETFNVDNGVSNDITLECIEGRYDFAATYLPATSRRHQV